jgi:hypothetical protein
MSTRLTLLAVVAALVVVASGCGASDTATSQATDDPSVAKAGGRDDALALGRGAIAPLIDYGTPNQSKPTKVGILVHEVRIGDFNGF